MQSMSDGDALLEELAAADDECERRQAAVEDVGEGRIEQTADAHSRFMTILDRYEGSATGSGDFKAFIKFQEDLADFVQELPDDLPHRDAFEGVETRMDKRRVTEDDFEYAREDVAPAADLVARLSDRDDAFSRYREARHDVTVALSNVKERITDLETQRDRGATYQALAVDGDVEAVLADISDPIQTYNDAVQDAFHEFKANTSAQDVLAAVERASMYSLVDVDAPPADVHDYLSTHSIGEKPIPEVLSFADYSLSKLDHYVDDPQELKRRVATHRTYLERLDAEPLTVTWPPSDAATLQWRTEDLVRAIDTFAPPETVQLLRDVRAQTFKNDRFDEIAAAARARDALDADTIERIENGTLERTLEDARDRKQAFEDALDENPER